MNPERFEGSTAIFLTSQLYIHGWPDEYGYTNYLVMDDGPDYVMDYQDETGTETRGKLRPVHRYNRVERFTTTLAQLLGLRDPMGNSKWPNLKSMQQLLVLVQNTLAAPLIGATIEDVPYHIPRSEIFNLTRPHATWDNIRLALKTTGNSKYYNYIPSLMRLMGQDPITFGDTRQRITYTLFKKMINDFQLFQGKYLQLEGRAKYFPSLRYIAFKIMEDNDAAFNDVVFIRTLRIEVKLDLIWDNIMYV